MSRDVVNQTLSTLDKAGVAPNTPLHVSLPANATQFETAFREFLITKLVQNGAVVPVSYTHLTLPTTPYV